VETMKYIDESFSTMYYFNIISFEKIKPPYLEKV